MFFKGDIYRASKKNGQEAMKLSSHSETITDLSVFYSSKQSGTNQCASENGGCDNLCLALPDPERRDSLHPTSKFTCACPTHHTLKDKKCSRKFIEFIAIDTYTVHFILFIKPLIFH